MTIRRRVTTAVGAGVFAMSALTSPASAAMKVSADVVSSRGYCSIKVRASGFASSTSYRVVAEAKNSGVPFFTSDLTVTTSARGTFSTAFTQMDTATWAAGNNDAVDLWFALASDPNNPILVIGSVSNRC